MTSAMIKLKSSDGEIFEVEVKVAQLSLTIKGMLDDLGVEENDVIPIPQNAPNISGTVLGKIITWANHHKNDHAAAEHDEKTVKSTSDISSWDTKFLKVDHATLVQMILAADYLNIKGLLDLTCKKMAKMIKGMTVEEVRRTFRIQNDFTVDEEEQVRKENAWYERIRFPEDNSPMDDSVMDDILLDSAHDVDDDGGEVIYLLNNSVVLGKIFQHLSNLELVEFSRLNQMWHYEALSLISKRGDMIASLNFNESCQVAQAFTADLQQMTVVPFHGMKIVLPEIPDCIGSCQCAISATDPTVDIIFDPLPFQALSLQLGASWCADVKCRGFVLAKKILQDLSVVIEELSLCSSYNSARDIFNEVIREFSFPRLKVLKLEVTNYRTLIHPVYLTALIFRSPNLQEVHVDKPTPDLVAVVHGSSVTLVCSGEISVVSDWIPENMMNGALRLQKIKLVYDCNRSFDIDGFNRIVPRLLQAPCTSTLYELTVDSVFAAPLVCYGVCFETVRKLTLVIDYNELQQPELHHILRLVKNFNFTRVFPNLTKVHIEMLIVDKIKQLPASLDRFILEANAILREPIMPDRATNIKELHLHCHDLTSATAPLFAQMLPNIERLYVEGPEVQNPFNFESICEHFVNLRELHIKSNSLENTANFDCDFCGISFDEVVQLMQKDDAYLQRVNIVPVKPSIACLTNLRVLNLEYDLERRPEPVIYDARNPMFFLSKITGLVVLARCPNLAVNLKIFPDGARTVSHLKPYVAVDLYN